MADESDEVSPTVRAIRAVQAEAEDRVFDVLLDDWDYGKGNTP